MKAGDGFSGNGTGENDEPIVPASPAHHNEVSDPVSDNESAQGEDSSIEEEDSPGSEQ